MSHRPHDALLATLPELAQRSKRWNYHGGGATPYAGQALSEDLGFSPSYLRQCVHRGYIADLRVVYVLRRLLAFWKIDEADYQPNREEVA